MHQLTSPSLMDPRWFNEVRSGEQEAIAIDDRSVMLKGRRLYLANSSEVTLIPSQKVYIKLNTYFFLETEEERAARLRKIQEQKAKEVEEERRRLNAYREDAEAFNATLHIPVQWVAGQKDVLSGLSENSNGDGRNKATVEHIMLKEDLQDGRLVRKAGAFLCTAESGSNGKQWSGKPENIAYDGNNKPYQPKITCKACLKIANRWNDIQEARQDAARKQKAEYEIALREGGYYECFPEKDN